MTANGPATTCGGSQIDLTARPGRGRRFFARAPRIGAIPAEVTTGRAPAYPRTLIGEDRVERGREV